MPWLLASIVLGNPAWKWLPAVAGSVSLLTLIFAYLNVNRPLAWKFSLAALKLLALGLILLCLLNPMWTRKQIKPGENIVLILVDNSASLNIQNEAGTSRGAVFKKALTDAEPTWRTRVEQDFDVRLYQFGNRLSQVKSFTDLNFDNSASNLSYALNELQSRFEAQPVAAILLFTDGNGTDHTAVGFVESTESSNTMPVYAVTQMDDTATLPDLRIEQVSVNHSTFEDAPISVNAKISVQAMDLKQVEVSLVSLDTESDEETADAETYSQEQRIDGQETFTARFQVRPKKPGVNFYRLKVRPVPESDGTNSTAEITEATLANNERLVAIDRGEKEHRLLYVGGRPNWEHKFLNRALAEDDALKLVSLIRISRKEAKFDFRGRAGEDSNSLFRGFQENADEETEAYDQAVLIRLSTLDKDELSSGFPKNKTDLYRYKAVILDDVEAAFFSHDQLVLLDRFVTERGGGLLMLGGRDSYRHGAWHKSPLKDALPIYLDRPGDKPGTELHWDLTREGWLEPWMRLRETEAAEEDRLSGMPPFTLLNSSREVKPGARVLANVLDESSQEIPSMVVQKYGKGSTGAVLVGDLWRWSLQREENSEDDLGKAWRQIVRWLVNDVPTKIETSYTWTQLGQIPATHLMVSVSDDEFQPRDNSSVQITVYQPDGTQLELNADASLVQAGLFEADYVPRSAGVYRAEIKVLDENGLEAGTSEIGWTHDPLTEEFQEVAVNQAFLKELTSRSKGDLISISDLDEFAMKLPLKELPVTEIQTTPLWHTPWLLLMAIACLAGEWGLRRWRGLP